MVKRSFYRSPKIKTNNIIPKKHLTISGLSFLAGFFVSQNLLIGQPKSTISQGEYIIPSYPGFSSKTSHTIENEVIHYINNAEQEIYMNGYGFTSEEIAKSIINAHQRGINVYILLDRSNEQNRSKILDMLSRYIQEAKSQKDQASFEIYIRDISGIHHAKVIIVDEKILILGSYNWTKSAKTKNDELDIFTHNPECAREAKRIWHIWKDKKSHQYGDAITNTWQPWKLEYNLSDQKDIDESKTENTSIKQHVHSLTSHADRKINGKLHDNQNRTELNKIYRDNLNKQRQQIISIANGTDLQKIQTSKYRCYMQIKNLDQNTLDALVHSKQQGVDISILTTEPNQSVKNYLVQNQIQYRILDNLNFNKTIHLVDDAIFITTKDAIVLYLTNYEGKNLCCVYKHDANNNYSLGISLIKNQVLQNYIQDTIKMYKQ